MIFNPIKEDLENNSIIINNYSTDGEFIIFDLVPIDMANQVISLDELANNVVLGPVRDLEAKLESFQDNYAWGHNPQVKKLGFRKDLGWKAGNYNEVKDLISKHFLQFDMKPRGMDSIFKRVDEGIGYMRGFRNQLRVLEDMRLDCRRRGLKKGSTDFNTDEIVEKIECFIDKLLDGMDEIRQMTGGDLDLRASIWKHPDCNNNIQVHITGKLSNTSLNLVNSTGLASLGSIDVRPIYLQFQVPFVNWFLDDWESVNMNRSVSRKRIHAKGCYPYSCERHPYIQSPDTWGSVCFSGYEDDIYTNLLKCDFVAFAMALNNWTSIYNYSHTHPHWKPFWLNYGLPKDLISTKILVNKGDITKHCARRMSQHSSNKDYDQYKSINWFEESHKLIANCHAIDCQLKEDCNAYGNLDEAMRDREEKICLLQEIFALGELYPEFKDCVYTFNSYSTLEELYKDIIQPLKTLQDMFYSVLERTEIFKEHNWQYYMDKAGLYSDITFYNRRLDEINTDYQTGNLSVLDYHDTIRNVKVRRSYYKTALEIKQKENTHVEIGTNL